MSYASLACRPDIRQLTAERDRRFGRKQDEGEIVGLGISHLPAPGIDILRRKGYRTWTTEDDRTIRTYVSKTPAS